MSEQQITYNIETKLSVPDGIGLDSVKVRIEISPATAGCIIYGYNAAGDIQPIQFMGGGDFDLPFVNPQIYIKYLGQPTNFSLSTLEWKEARGQPRPSPVPPDQKH